MIGKTLAELIDETKAEWYEANKGHEIPPFDKVTDDRIWCYLIGPSVLSWPVSPKRAIWQALDDWFTDCEMERNRVA